MSRSDGTTEDWAGAISWRTGVGHSPSDGKQSRLCPAQDRGVGWHRGANAVALGVATLAGALGLATLLASPTLFVASLGPTAPDRVSVSAGGTIAAPVHTPAADRERHRPRERATDTAPQGTAKVWEKTDVSYWRSLVTHDQHDARAFLLATAFQRWIPPALVATPRSPVVFPSKEG